MGIRDEVIIGRVIEEKVRKEGGKEGERLEVIENGKVVIVVY